MRIEIPTEEFRGLQILAGAFSVLLLVQLVPTRESVRRRFESLVEPSRTGLRTD